MILPSKHLSQDRALLTVGAVILRHLSEPITASALWEQVSRSSRDQTAPSALRYDAFVLALDLCFSWAGSSCVRGCSFGGHRDPPSLQQPLFLQDACAEAWAECAGGKEGGGCER